MGVSFCLDCEKKVNCKSICAELEKELKKVTVSMRRNKVTIVDPQFMDKVNYKESWETGKRKKPIVYGDGYELNSF